MMDKIYVVKLKDGIWLGSNTADDSALVTSDIAKAWRAASMHQAYGTAEHWHGQAIEYTPERVITQSDVDKEGEVYADRAS